MKVKRIYTLADNQFPIQEIVNDSFLAAEEQQPFENRKIAAGLLGFTGGMKKVLKDVAGAKKIQLDFLDDERLRNKIFDDEKCDAVLYFTNSFPPLKIKPGGHLHWSKFRNNDWLRSRINYSFINSINLGSDVYSTVLECAEILRLRQFAFSRSQVQHNCFSNLGTRESGIGVRDSGESRLVTRDPKTEPRKPNHESRTQNFALYFLPEEPLSPVPVHSAVIAAALLGFNVSLLMPEEFPLDFEVLSKAEIIAARNNKDFNVSLKPDTKKLAQADIIMTASWAQLCDNYHP